MRLDHQAIKAFIEHETGAFLNNEKPQNYNYELLKKQLVAPYQALVFPEDESFESEEPPKAKNMWITLHEVPGDGYNGSHIAFDPELNQWFLIAMDPTERYRFIRPAKTFESLYKFMLNMKDNGL